MVLGVNDMNKNYNQMLLDFIAMNSETEWLEFKENLDNEQQIGEYISALSNAASIWDRDYAYLVWGVSDQSKDIVGTKFNHRRNINKSNEVLEYYLARNLTPSIAFKFIETFYQDKRIIMLEIPKAKKTPTAFKGERYIRIDSSKANVKKFPEREVDLFYSLREEETITTKASQYQRLTFSKLFVFYAARGLILSKDTFEENLDLKNKDGKYNLLAQLLADDNHIPIRISTFNGTSKTDHMTGIEDFGNNCLLYAFDDILRYGKVINKIQSSDDGKIPRVDIPYFDHSIFNEALINAFVHNEWLDQHAPQIHVFSDRIEIISHGGLPRNQTIDNFFRGVSKPRNKALAEIFMQLHISEKTGRGVPRIVNKYGKDVFEFGDGILCVTIPFNIIWKNSTLIHQSQVINSELKLTDSQKLIVSLMKDNPNVTIAELALATKMSDTGVYNNINRLRSSGLIERIGSNKNGYWKIKAK